MPKTPLIRNRQHAIDLVTWAARQTADKLYRENNATADELAARIRAALDYLVIHDGW